MNESHPSRRPYEPPTAEVLGTVDKLTLAGAFSGVPDDSFVGPIIGDMPELSGHPGVFG